MAHIAKLDGNSIVTDVYVIHNNELLDEHGNETETKGIAFVKSLYGEGSYVQTSINKTFRKNYAGVGFLYDPIRDAFIPPKPYPSWTLNESTCDWDPPVPKPEPRIDYYSEWHEDSQTWVEVYVK
jgi:hypothetical protein